MPAYRNNQTLFRLSARLIVVGTWIGVTGALIIYFAKKLMSSLAQSFVTKTSTTEATPGLENLVIGSMVMFYKGGLASVAVGVVLMGFGSIFISASLK